MHNILKKGRVNWCILFFIVVFVHLNEFAIGQSIAINNSNQMPHSSAILDISSDSLGMLLPRLTFAARTEMENPPEGLLIYQIDEAVGIYFFKNTGWVKFVQKELDLVPVGGVLDWLPFGQAIPAGFKICDGTVISDVESPYYNEVVPDLNEKFIKSVDTLNLNTTGGSSSHNHDIIFSQFTNYTSTADFTHQHTVAQQNILTNNENHYHSLSNPFVSFETHNHKWATLNSNENWRSFDSNGDGIEMVNWSNGMDAAGSGNYPIAIFSLGGLDQSLDFYTSNNQHTHSNASAIYASGSHSHTIVVPGVGESKNEDHGHYVGFSATTSSSLSTIPLSIKMVKIMRIK